MLCLWNKYAYTNLLYLRSKTRTAFSGSLPAKQKEDKTGKYKLKMMKLKVKWKTERLADIINFVFVNLLSPFGIIWKTYAHCTHLQITQAYPQTEICKRVQFFQHTNN